MRDPRSSLPSEPNPNLAPPVPKPKTHQLLRQPVVLGREGLLLRRRFPPLHRSVPSRGTVGVASAVGVLQMLLLVGRSSAAAARTLRLLRLRRAVSSLLLPPVPPSGESLGLPHFGGGERGATGFVLFGWLIKIIKSTRKLGDEPVTKKKGKGEEKTAINACIIARRLTLPS